MADDVKRAEAIINDRDTKELQEKIQKLTETGKISSENAKKLLKQFSAFSQETSKHYIETKRVNREIYRELQKSTRFASNLNKVLSFSVKSTKNAQKSLEVKFTKLTRAIFGITRSEIQKQGAEVFKEKVFARTLLQQWGTEISKQFGMNLELFGDRLGLELRPIRMLIDTIKGFYQSFVGIRNIIIKGGYILTTFMKGTWVEKLFGKPLNLLQNLFAKGVTKITTLEERRRMYSKAFETALGTTIKEAHTPEGKEILKKEIAKILGEKFEELPAETQKKVVNTYVKQLDLAYSMYNEWFVPYMKNVARSTAKVLTEFEDFLTGPYRMVKVASELVRDEQRMTEESLGTVKNAKEISEKMKKKAEEIDKEVKRPTGHIEAVKTKESSKLISKLTGGEVGKVLKEHPLTRGIFRIANIIGKIFIFLKGKAFLDLFKNVWGGIRNIASGIYRFGAGLLGGVVGEGGIVSSILKGMKVATLGSIIARGIGGALNRILPTELKRSFMHTKIGSIIGEALGISVEDIEKIRKQFEEMGPKIKNRVLAGISNIVAGVGESILKLPLELSKVIGKLTFKPLADLFRSIGASGLARTFEVAYANLNWTFKQIFTGVRVLTNWAAKIIALPIDTINKAIEKLTDFFKSINRKVIELRAKLGDWQTREIINQERIVRRALEVSSAYLRKASQTYADEFHRLTQSQVKRLQSTLNETARILIEQGKPISEVNKTLSRITKNYIDRQIVNVKKIEIATDVVSKKIEEGVDSLSEKFSELEKAVNIPGLEGVIDKYKDFILKTYHLKIPVTVPLPHKEIEAKLTAEEKANLQSAANMTKAMQNIKVEVPERKEEKVASMPSIGEMEPVGESKLPSDTAMAMFKFLLGA